MSPNGGHRVGIPQDDIDSFRHEGYEVGYGAGALMALEVVREALPDSVFEAIEKDVRDRAGLPDRKIIEALRKAQEKA